MSRLLIPLAAFALALTAPAAAQRFPVTGAVVDSTGAALAGASVVVLAPADSALVAFGITRADGAFRVERVPAGEHLLQVSFVGYRARTLPLVVEGVLDVGAVVLAETAGGLAELTVTAERVPMVMRADTLEYDAAAFTVPPNANVEELLRRLPGVEVDRDGTVTAQGQRVRQVLVDGREFFGNDPTVATRNLPADAVDRVQVYDRRSDTAEFTGVDDGNESRTINLALRPERRQGRFGNATAGVGDPARYEGRTSINQFSPEQQLSFIGSVNNVNEQTFGVQDYVAFMGGMQALAAEGGMIRLDAAPGMGPGTGFTTSASAGLNLNRTLRRGTTLRASYLGALIDQDLDRSVLRRELAGPAADARSAQEVDQWSRQWNHRLNAHARYTFAEGHDVQLRSDLRVLDGRARNLTLRETTGGAGLRENDSRTSYASASGSLNGEGTLTYRRRLAPGRTVAAELRAAATDADLSGELDALNRFYRAGDLLTTEEIAQLQAQATRTLTHAQRLTYTEPLGLRQLLSLEAEHRAVHEDQERTVTDLTAGAPVVNPALSSDFDRTYRYVRAGATFRRAVAPLTLSLGAAVQRAQLDGAIRQTDLERRAFVRVLPSAVVTYALSNAHSLDVRYTAATREPTLRELQPFADNTDPLNVYVGNPGLRPEYAHTVALQYMRFDPFAMTNLMAFVRAGYTQDRISRARTIDEALRQTIAPVNVDGDWTLSANVNFGAPLRPLGLRLNASRNTTYNRGRELINGAENTSYLLRSAWDLRVENRAKDVLDAQLGVRYTLNDVRYSLNPRLDRRYASGALYSEARLRLGAGWRVMAGLDYGVYSGDVFGEGRHVPLLRSEVSRMLLNDRVELRLEGRDLLDRNVGVNASNTLTYVQEERVETLGRYVMLKAVYNLTPVRGPQPGGMIVRTTGG